MKRAHNDNDDSPAGATNARPAPVRAETGHATMPERQRLAIARLVIDKLKLASIIKEPCSRFALLPADIVNIVFGWYLRDAAVEPPPGPFASSVFGEPPQTRLSSDYGCYCFKKAAHYGACKMHTERWPWSSCKGECEQQYAPQDPEVVTTKYGPTLFASGPDLIVVRGDRTNICVIANIWTSHEVHCCYPISKGTRKLLANCIASSRCTAKRHENGSIVFHTAGHTKIVTLTVDSDGCLTHDLLYPPSFREACAADAYWNALIGYAPCDNYDFITKDRVAYTVQRSGMKITVVRRVDPLHGTVVCDIPWSRMYDAIRTFTDQSSNVCIMVYERGMFDHVCQTKFIWLARGAELFSYTGYEGFGPAIEANKAPAVVDQAGRLCTITLDEKLIAIAPTPYEPDGRQDFGDYSI